ncbi:DUF2523 domain-containing protein [Methylobacillus sp.]|uniref:DUF2523 domain-containing protein n=1 Tax=Methylobacillus sp. TaxID=56818 RepID=UPI0012C03E2E|nr:DUF2523 domain-containing protein [Methylobacillus sp.]MPS47805.1 DUF2523 domain-containing protein [Methylobacillus sp.]
MGIFASPAAWLVAAIVGGFSKGLMEGIVKFLTAMGIGWAMYQGLDVLIQQILTGIKVNLGALPPEMVGMLGVLKVDKCLNVIGSAFMVRLVLKGVTNGVFTKLEIKQ